MNSIKISTKGRYGLRAMIDLVINSNGDQVSLNSIAERQDVSENYLEQVFSILRKAGLVKSVKGAQGGYVLSDSASRITVGDVLRALEGDLAIVDDKDDGVKAPSNVEDCIRAAVWDKINESINKVVDSMTLEDVANEYRRLLGGASFMFYI